MHSADFHLTDLLSAQRHIAQLPLHSPNLAQDKIHRLLDALLTVHLPADDLLTLLEQMHSPVTFVGEEMGRRYQNRPLPLAPEEETAFQIQAGIYRRVAVAYKRCADLTNSHHDAPDFQARMAMLLQRALHYAGLLIFEHYRARRTLPDGIWKELHALYAFVELLDVPNFPVIALEGDGVESTNCSATYIATILIDVANPPTHSMRNLSLIRHWASTFASLATIQEITDDTELPPYCIELEKDLPLHQTGEFLGRDARRIDTSLIGLQISHLLEELKRRNSPAQLGLGEENTSHVIPLLSKLSRPWTQQASPRRFRRFPNSATLPVVTEFDAIHSVMLADPIDHAPHDTPLTRHQFGTPHRFDPLPKSIPSPQKPVPSSHETWRQIDMSVSGFRLCRETAGKRINLGQLLAVCPEEDDGYLLCRVTWLMQEGPTPTLIAGVSVFPGMPEAVGAKSQTSQEFIHAFLLPEVNSVHSEPSIILPNGYFQPKRHFLIQHAGTQYAIQLRSILERGVDFERIVFDRV